MTRQAIARAMGAAPLATADLADIAAVYQPFATSTPLWYYILAEAKAATTAPRRLQRQSDATRGGHRASRVPGCQDAAPGWFSPAVL